MNFSKILKLSKKDKKISLYYAGECFAAVPGAIYRLSDMPEILTAAEFFNVCGIDQTDGWEVKIERELGGSPLFGIFTGEELIKHIKVERDCTVSLGGTVAALFGVPENEQLEIFGTDDGEREDYRIPVSPSLLSPLTGIVTYKYLFREGDVNVIGAYERDELVALIRPDADMLSVSDRLHNVVHRTMKFAGRSNQRFPGEDGVWEL